MAKRERSGNKRAASPGLSRAAAEKLLSGTGAPRYSLRLYVAGTNQNSSHAIENLMRLRDFELRDRCDVQIVDMYQQPELAAKDGVVAAPTLVKLKPAPRVIFIGDLSDSSRLLAGLGIRLKSSNVRNSTLKKQ